MALDGLAVYSIQTELAQLLTDARIDKIQQPEKDDLIFTIRTNNKNYKLLLSANSQTPRINISTFSKQSPLTAPQFCMILRKHLQGGRILKVEQPNFERIINITVVSLDEFGEYTEKTLVIEMMGKHSNIILLNSENKIIDSIIRVNFEKSSVREVLPNRPYTLPVNDKLNPLNLNFSEFNTLINTTKEDSVSRALFLGYTGISPLFSNEVVFKSKLDDNIACYRGNDANTEALYNVFKESFDNLINKNFEFKAFYNEKDNLFDFSVYPVSMYSNYKYEEYETVSELIENFYNKKSNQNRMSQKTSDLRRHVQNAIDRTNKKIDIGHKTLADCKNKDKHKLNGELITANIYKVQKGDSELVCENFYSEDLEPITIKLDVNKTPQENAQKYFKAYNKKKRAEIASKEQLLINESELKYLESVMVSLNSVETNDEIDEIREELRIHGYIKKQAQKNKKVKPSKFLTFESSDGFEILVGKNNSQNDYLTTRLADKTDIWCHIKNDAGSHVIIRSHNKEVPDTTIFEACMLAGFYSKSRDGSNVPIDYTIIKEVKKPNGSKAGMVIYLSNKTMYVTPKESEIEKIKKL